MPGERRRPMSQYALLRGPGACLEAGRDTVDIGGSRRFAGDERCFIGGAWGHDRAGWGTLTIFPQMG